MSSGKQKIEVVLAATDKGLSGALGKVDRAMLKTIRAGQKYRETLSDLNGHADALRGSLLRLGAAIVSGAIFRRAASDAFGFNQAIEQSRIGIAALIRTFKDVDMAQSFAMADEIQKRLQVAGLKTTATYEQLLRALQEGIGPALRENFNPKQIVAFTSAMTQAAAALALPMDQLGQELRAILDGTIDRNARIAKALQITNADVKNWKAAGTLFANLQDRLKAFAAAGDQAANTFAGAWSNMQDAIQMALGTGTRRAFAATTAAIKRLTRSIVTIDEQAGTFTFNKKIMAALDGVDKRISQFLDSLTTDDIASAMESLVKTMGVVLDVVIRMGKGIAYLVKLLGPLAPSVATVAGNYMLWTMAAKALIFPLTETYRRVKAMNSALALITGSGFITWLGAARDALVFIRTELGLVGRALTTMGSALLAWEAGWKIGTFLNRFDVVKRAGVAMAAGLTKAWLNAKKAWTWLTGGDTAAVQREIDEADRIYAKMFADVGRRARQAGKTVAAAHEDAARAAKQSAVTQQQVTGKALKEMERQYRKYADEVIRLNEEIKNRQRSLAEQLRAMGRSGMGALAAWRDRKKEAREYERVARKAARAGDFKTAVQYADMAKRAYADLNKEVKVSTEKMIAMKKAEAEAIRNSGWSKGSYQDYLRLQREILALERKVSREGSNSQETVISKQQALKEAMAGVKRAGELAISALRQQQDEAKKAMEALTKKSGFADLEKGMDASKRRWLDNWRDMQAATMRQLDKIEQRIRKITSDKHMTIYVNEVVKKAVGGAVRRLASGGRLAGFGGGDRIPALLEAGEYVIRKEAVARFGEGIFHALNSLRYPPIPRFASGGPVAVGSGGSTVNINLTIGQDGPYPMQADPMTTEKMLRDLARRRRLRSS